MPRKPVTNFGKVQVSTGYDADATSIVLVTGHGAKLPATFPYPLVWWNSIDFSDPADDVQAEIVNVTARATDTLTVTRGQEGTSASTKNAAGKTYLMVLAWTKAMHDDLLTGEPGTIALFQQTAAPIGWTKNTTHNDKALRVVSGTASSGGATAFTSVFGSGKLTGSHTLTQAESAAITRRFSTGLSTGGAFSAEFGSGTNPPAATGATATYNNAPVALPVGGGGGHNHTLSLDLQFVDIILCTKD